MRKTGVNIVNTVNTHIWMNARGKTDTMDTRRGWTHADMLVTASLVNTHYQRTDPHANITMCYGVN